jgi:Putative metallopeptidase
MDPALVVLHRGKPPSAPGTSPSRHTILPLVSPSKRGTLLAIALLVSLGALVAGCGSSDSTSSTEPSDTAAAIATSGGQVTVTWQEPESEVDQLGYELLKASETKYLAEALAKAFNLPNPLVVKGVNGVGGGPFYDPEHNSITLPYGFAALIFEVLVNGNPEASEEELGERVGAVNSFILEHEFGHALIANYDLPVLGKEEDAADAIATALLLKAEGGAGYAAAASAFWADFSGRQEPPAVSDYADAHSLDLQRAFDVLCWVAGSSEQSFQEVAELEALPESRLAGCPQEYEQVVDSITQELEPHLKGGVNLTPAE